MLHPAPLSIVEEFPVEKPITVEELSPNGESLTDRQHHTTVDTPKTNLASHRKTPGIGIDTFLQMTEEQRWVLEDEMSPEELVRLTTQISDDDLLQIMAEDIRVAKQRSSMDKEYIRVLETELLQTTLLTTLHKQRQKLLERLSTEELTPDEHSQLNAEIDKLTTEIHSCIEKLDILDKATDSHQKELRNKAETLIKNFENNQTQRLEPLKIKTDKAYQQQQEAFETDLAKLKSTIIEAFSDIAHIEEVDGRLEVISWYPKETLPGIASTSMNSEEQLGIESHLDLETAYDPVNSLITAQQSIKAWRAGLDVDYFDVVVSRALTAEEIDKYFPTKADRESLKQRTTEMQKSVVSKVRKLVNDMPNATQRQKYELARQLVNDNFDNDFAESVIRQLQFDEK